MNELAWLSIGELAPLIQSRQVSPVEAAEVVLSRAARLDPQLNCHITLMAEQALAAARQAEAEVARGDYRGDVAGVPNTFGSKILRQNVPAADAEVVRRLRAAGAVIVGKHNLEEFAFGITNNNPHYGPTRNPWDPGCIPGGSSGGTAAAVAAGLCYAGLGSDTGGSIRIPAALCGVASIKPTYGRVSRQGALPLAWSLDHVGPLARTVGDLALVLQAIADPGAAPVPDYPVALTGEVRGLVLGIPREWFYTHLDPGVREAVAAAQRLLEALGARLEEVSIPLADHSQAILAPIISAEAATWHQRWLRERPEDYGEAVRARLQYGALVPATLYLEAQRLRQELQRQFVAALSRVHALLVPTVPVPAPRIGQERVDVGGVEMEVRQAGNRLTCPANLAGLPAASVPCGFAGGLPVGLQIIGRPWDEATVLQVAHAYEQAAGWHRRRPPVDAGSP